MLRLFAWAANVTVEIAVPVYIAIWLFKQGTTSAYFLAVVWIFICICAGLDWLLRAKEIENREKHKQWFREPGTIYDAEAKAGGFIRSQIPRFRLPESVSKGAYSPLRRSRGQGTPILRL